LIVVVSMALSQTSSFYNYSSAIQALVLWGGWSYYINSKVSVSAGIKSGLAQGVASFFLTLIVVFLVTRFFNYFKISLLKFTVPTLLVVSMLLTFLVSLHTMVGTPEILKTIAPPLTMAVLFCVFTTYKLSNEKAY